MVLFKNMRLLKSMYTKFMEHIELTMSAMFIGILLVFCEFLITSVYLLDFYRYTVFHFFLWFPTLLTFLYIIYKSMQLCCKKLNFGVFIFSVLAMTVPLFVIYIYCYALPVFLLLLVYPTKVIAVVAYLITFVFAASMICSITMRMITMSAVNCKVIGKWKSTMMIINGIIIFANPIFMFIIVIHFLYALVLGEASAISTGPYTVLSLIPTTAISAAGWLIKNKVFSSVEEEEDKNQESNENKEENEDEKKSATNSGEALTLVVNEETPFNGSDQEVMIKTYGAAGNG